MTSNQIRYWELNETTTHNRNTERETNRSNLAREAETRRSNLAREKETNRHNLATEKETNRSNLARELLTTLQREQDARIAQRNYEISYFNSRENARHNSAVEALQLQQMQQQLKAVQTQVAEQSRHNQASERATLQSLDETKRSNLAREANSAATIAETQRSNLAQEILKERSLENESKRVMIESQRTNESARHNRATESETHRANLTRETIDRMNAVANTMRASGQLMEGLSSSGALTAAGKGLSKLRGGIALWQIRR